MSCGTTELQDEGIIMTDVVDPWPLFFFGLMMGGPRQASLSSSAIPGRWAS